MRGIRIDFSSPDSRDEVHLGEETLSVYKGTLDKINRTMPGFRNSARDDLAPGGTNYLGAVYSGLIKPPRVHTLSAAYCFAPDSEGLSVSTFKQALFRFPDQGPSRLSAAIAPLQWIN